MRSLKASFVFCSLILSATSLFGQQSATFNYISPAPGSRYINPENNIALRHGDKLNPSSVRGDIIKVYGSQQGAVNGELKLSADERTLLFIPDSPFRMKETVSVEVGEGISTESGIELSGTSFSFTIKPRENYSLLVDFYQREDQLLVKSINERRSGEGDIQDTYLQSRQTDDYPEGFPVPVIAEFDDPAPGYIFSGPRPNTSKDYDPYLLILDNYGTPVFYQEWIRRTNDFKTLPNNQLTFCDFSNPNPEINKYLVLDSKFSIVDTLTMGNGYLVDQHDIIMRENGNHFLMAYDPQLVNMDTVYAGGDTAATVTGFVIQELDPDHNVIFQWRSWDHYEITDANHTDFTAKNIDYVHGNAFEIDYDGNLLISSRNMEEITKIDLNTGEIIWRFGLHAKKNMFTFTNDTVGFSWQHDVRRIDNGNITVYDNGNYHDPKFSQAVEYLIDEENFTAELVWNYIHDPVVYARATGAHRRLPNGNAFICWGLTWPINISEVDMNGSLRWEMHWPQMDIWEYRSFKLEWVTDYFETSVDTIDYGEYDDYVPWPRIFTIKNNADHDIQITSTHNHWNSYTVTTPLPLDIPAGGTAQMTVNFFPTMQGHIDDVLTLNYESMVFDTLPRRVSRQVFLTGYVPDSRAPETSISPSDGSENVPQDVTITIEFDEPVTRSDGKTIKSDELSEILIFRENEGEDVNYKAYVDVWKTKITIIPDTLMINTDYRVEVKANSVTDREGNVIADPQVSIFSTISDEGMDETILDHIKVYPNPANGRIYVDTDHYTARFAKIIDIKGETIIDSFAGPDGRISFDLGNYPVGIYFVEIFIEEFNGSVSVKVVRN